MLSRTMLAGILHGSRDLRLSTVSCPVPQPGQVLLRVLRAGVCGSDMHYFAHGRCGEFVPSQPFILGHEFVATVESTIQATQRFGTGDRVVVSPAASCGQCEICKSGRASLCPNVVMLGSASTTPPTDGAFADFIAVSAHQCHRVPNSVSDSVAALAEPLSVVLHAIRRASGVSGNRVLITGAGPIGALAAVVSRAYGASLVVVSEPSDCRRWMALNLGIDHSLDPMDCNLTDEALAVSDGGYDVVFEASGAPQAIRQCIGLVRRGGKILQIGTVADNNVDLPVNDLMVREISLIGTFRYADEFSEAIRFMAAGRVPLESLVTGIFPLTELPHVMESAFHNNESLKMQVVVGE